MSASFRQALAAAASQAAIAYGYTLTVWSSGAVLIDLDGKPAIGDVFLFLGGAVAAFLAVELVATRAFRDFDSAGSRKGLLVGGLMHVLSAGVAVGCAAAVGALLDGAALWPIASFSATLAYLLLAGLQIWLGERLADS